MRNAAALVEVDIPTFAELQHKHDCNLQQRMQRNLLHHDSLRSAGSAATAGVYLSVAA